MNEDQRILAVLVDTWGERCHRCELQGEPEEERTVGFAIATDDDEERLIPLCQRHALEFLGKLLDERPWE